MGAQWSPVLPALHTPTHQHSNIKAETDNEKKCKECCTATTVPATTTPSPTTKPTVAPTSTKKAFFADTTASTAKPGPCAGYDTVKLCDEKCGAVSFSISVLCVLASVILSLHV